MNRPPRPDFGDERARVNRFVIGKVLGLQEGYLAGRSSARAAVARLRRNVQRPYGQDPTILPLIVDPDAPEVHSPAPTFAENAVLATLTLYATHQQSKSVGVHVPERSFGAALSLIRLQGQEERPGVLRRFSSAILADDFDEVRQRLRGLVQLLKQADRGFDYGLLASDLFDLQSPVTRSAVRLRWGRDFYRVDRQSEAVTETGEEHD